MYNVGTYDMHIIFVVCIGFGIAVYPFIFDARRFYTPTL
jgi:hypothetical protein